MNFLITHKPLVVHTALSLATLSLCFMFFLLLLGCKDMTMFKWIKSLFRRRELYALSTQLLSTHGGELRPGTKSILIVRVGNEAFPVFQSEHIDRYKNIVRQSARSLGC